MTCNTVETTHTLSYIDTTKQHKTTVYTSTTSVALLPSLSSCSSTSMFVSNHEFFAITCLSCNFEEFPSTGEPRKRKSCCRACQTCRPWTSTRACQCAHDELAYRHIYVALGSCRWDKIRSHQWETGPLYLDEHLMQQGEKNLHSVFFHFLHFRTYSISSTPMINGTRAK